jgi:hypothetical protein
MENIMWVPAFPKKAGHYFHKIHLKNKINIKKQEVDNLNTQQYNLI